MSTNKKNKQNNKQTKCHTKRGGNRRQRTEQPRFPHPQQEEWLQSPPLPLDDRGRGAMGATRRYWGCLLACPSVLSQAQDAYIVASDQCSAHPGYTHITESLTADPNDPVNMRRLLPVYAPASASQDQLCKDAVQVSDPCGRWRVNVPLPPPSYLILFSQPTPAPCPLLGSF